MALQLVWDMDGTLLDSTAVVPDAFVAAVRELGGGEVNRDDVVASYSRGVPEKILEHLLHRELHPGEEEAYYRRLLGAHLLPYDGVLQTLDKLRAMSHPVVVFTGASTRAATTLLQSAGIAVDLLIGGEMVHHPKPAPDGIQLAAKKLNKSPTKVVYVGDAPTDLQAAKAAAAISAAAAWGHLYAASEPADVTLDRPAHALQILNDH